MLSTGFLQFAAPAAFWMASLSLGITVGAVFYARYCRKWAQSSAAWAYETLEAAKLSADGALPDDYRKRVAELEDELAALSASHKRLRSKYGMADMRARKKGANLDDEEAAQTRDKRKLRQHAKERGLLRG